MEKQSKEKDPFLRKHLRDLPMENPSDDFSNDVLAKLHQPPLSKTPPLLSKTLLWCIGSIFLGSSILLWVWPDLSFFNVDLRNTIAGWEWPYSYNMPNMSQIAIYAVAFLSLFLLQIPLLLRERISHR